ncbi:lipopolysaccharide biosynthesis protein [Photobacterium phosphoreum]|uniref:lipopolysaccharide biosynthesis protein n=1 Tax=Photobacterium phosphoreum TaxID=659 RepID=UPI001E3D3629|nr:lipopolysaccharide biosynthesis protein [Photobacterium phosphoreum]MCD9504168.1 lipopolysaccharide biosynthesis protein [Photobacterium phosphoreum]
MTADSNSTFSKITTSEKALNGKRVLMIAPSFFGYDNDIKYGLEELGAIVDSFKERPFDSSLKIIINRLGFKFLIKNDIENYYYDILEKVASHKYDYIFAIAPETMPKSFLFKIKKLNADAITILYMWDSISNRKHVRTLLPDFDFVYSFDSGDVDKYKGTIFHPLFYNKIFDINAIKYSPDIKTEYDMTFIGTAHSDRANLVKRIFKHNNYINYLYLYCPSKILFICKKVFTNKYNEVSYNELFFSPIQKIEIRDIFIKSKVVVDIEHPKQSGLTMRTFELLGLKRKIITTNKNIVDYDFYNKNNIYVLDRNKSVIPKDFLDSPYVDIKKEILDKYSLSSWLKFMFIDGM